MKYSLSKKLFAITLLLISLIMLFAYCIQAFFFETFYVHKKTESLVSEVNKFHDLYSLHIDETTNLNQALRKFENDNNATIIITSTTGKIISYSGQGNSDQETTTVLANFYTELINNRDLIKDVTTNSKIRYTNFYNQYNDSQKIGVVGPMSINSKNDSLIFCVSSIQPIQEASDVINEFLLYLFLGLLTISAILAFIYSNLISKPLVTLTQVANQMANMNFSAVCTTDRKDEIGILAHTLNFLSKNLETSLLDLKAKNKKLELDIEKERKLENMRKEFTDNVSHELKTPIGIIEGYAEGIRDGVVSGEDANLYLETIIDESKKMSVLVTNMLELSKLESGIIKPNFEDFNINRLINKVLRKHEPEFEEHDYTVNFKCDSPYSYVYADPFQMEQVCTNLITNAIKYTPPHNDINIIITEGLDKFKLSVQNLGTTIPQEKLDKLFDKFYRVDNSRERTQRNSTGLGLSIVKNILNLHKSEFKIHNIENGVEFYFYLEKVIHTDEEEI